MNIDCENLDAFLAGELDTAADAHFQEHVRECSTCREAIAQDRWLDSLLLSPERLELETPPDSILESVRARMSHRRRTIRLAACGLAAAATVLFAVTSTLFFRQSSGPQAQDLAQETYPAGTTPPAPDPHATFVGGPDVIVVPIASNSPHVTVVRIYPTYRTSTDATNVEPTEDDLARPAEFNGG